MKKVAILTFHRTNNYGAALQAYALQRVLNEKYEAEILDYRNPYLEGLYLQKSSEIKAKIRVIARRVVYPKRTAQLDERRGRFENFYQQHFMLSDIVYNGGNIAQANERYDAFIAGSDQVWNLHLSRGDWNYFLEFAPPEKRYSYAASIAMNRTGEGNERIKDDLNQFQSILVRESKAVDFLSSIGVKKPVTAVSDPVFLLGTDEWGKILPSVPNSEKKKYVLLYTVANVTNSLEFAKRLAQRNNLTVISLSSKQSVNVVNGVTNILDAGPIEFLDYIRNASYVVTSSFHALAFSVIFNVPFYYELCRDGGNNNERLENIADIFHLRNREIISIEEPGDQSEPDWGAVNITLEKYRYRSGDVLFNSLHGV